jgi:hypothetical protein
MGSGFAVGIVVLSIGILLKLLNMKMRDIETSEESALYV